MNKIVVFMVFICFASLSIARDSSVQPRLGHEQLVRAETLDVRDLRAFKNAESTSATGEDKQLAEDICSKKCPECFDGVTCDLKCAKNACYKK